MLAGTGCIMYTVSHCRTGRPHKGDGEAGWGAQSSRSETLKHQRERHYPERTRKTESSNTNTVNKHTDTLDQKSKNV